MRARICNHLETVTSPPRGHTHMPRMHVHVFAPFLVMKASSWFQIAGSGLHRFEPKWLRTSYVRVDAGLCPARRPHAAITPRRHCLPFSPATPTSRKAGSQKPEPEPHTAKLIHTQVVPPPPPLPLLLAADVLGTVFGKLGLPPWHARLRFSVHSMVQVLPHNK